jgi:hypothetical protein
MAKPVGYRENSTKEGKFIAISDYNRNIQRPQTNNVLVHLMVLQVQEQIKP